MYIELTWLNDRLIVSVSKPNSLTNSIPCEWHFKALSPWRYSCPKSPQLTHGRTTSNDVCLWTGQWMEFERRKIYEIAFLRLSSSIVVGGDSSKAKAKEREKQTDPHSSIQSQFTRQIHNFQWHVPKSSAFPLVELFSSRTLPSQSGGTGPVLLVNSSSSSTIFCCHVISHVNLFG